MRLVIARTVSGGAPVRPRVPRADQPARSADVLDGQGSKRFLALAGKSSPDYHSTSPPAMQCVRRLQKRNQARTAAGLVKQCAAPIQFVDRNLGAGLVIIKLMRAPFELSYRLHLSMCEEDIVLDSAVD